MRRSPAVFGIGILSLSIFLAHPVFAETVELVTYYPAPGGGNVATDRLHASRATIGNNYSLTTPAVLDPGILLVEDRIGVGVDAPLGPLHVVGRNNAPESVIFMPGTGGTMSVGIGTTAPPSILSIGTDTAVSNTRRAVTIGNAGVGAPAANGTMSNGDKLVMWNATADLGGPYKAAIGFDGPNELWLQATGNSATNKITFYTSNNSTTPSQRMVIDSVGRVGIGTSAPATQFETVTTAFGQPRGILSSQYGAGVGGGLFIGRKGRGTQAAPAAVANGDNLLGFIPEGYDGTAYQQTGWMGFEVNGTVAAGSVPSDFMLFTGTTGQGVERLRVTSAGNVGIGTSAPAAALQVSRPTSDSAVRIQSGTPGGFQGNARLELRGEGNSDVEGFTLNYDNHGNVNFDQLHSTGNMTFRMQAAYVPTTAMVIQSNGTVNANVQPLSDAILKTEIQPMTGVLGKVTTLRGITYRWKDKNLDQQKQMGFSAQEVEKVFPELVRVTPDGLKTVAYDHLTAALVEAVKELKVKNDQLKQKVEADHQEIQTLKKALAGS